MARKNEQFCVCFCSLQKNVSKILYEILIRILLPSLLNRTIDVMDHCLNRFTSHLVLRFLNSSVSFYPMTSKALMLLKVLMKPYLACETRLKKKKNYNQSTGDICCDLWLCSLVCNRCNVINALNKCVCVSLFTYLLAWLSLFAHRTYWTGTTPWQLPWQKWL